MIIVLSNFVMNNFQFWVIGITHNYFYKWRLTHMLGYFYWFLVFTILFEKYFGYIKLEMYVYSQTNLYSTSWFKIIWWKIYFILRFTSREWLNIYILYLIYFLIILFYFKYFSFNFLLNNKVYVFILWNIVL